jgi:hypothetical protein
MSPDDHSRSARDDEAVVREFLAPLHRLDSMLPRELQPAASRRARPRRSLVLAAVVAILAAIAVAAAALNDNLPGRHAAGELILDERPAAGRMRVFSADEPAAQLPQAFARRMRALARSHANVNPLLQPGDLVFDHARLLLNGLGQRELAIYAVPATSGSVCYELAPIGGGCIDLFPADFPISWALNGFHDQDGSAHWWLSGIAADEVVGVSVRVAGSDEPARLERNAWFYEASPGVSDADLARATLIVTLVDGTTAERPVAP